MKISSNYLSMPSFKGLYEQKQVTTKTKGRSYYNKNFYKIYNIEYHPFPDESPAKIQNEINKNKKGVFFSIWEKDDGHVEGNYYYMNNIKLGKTIDPTQIPSEDEFKYTTEANGVRDKDYIYDVFENEAYSPMDYTELYEDSLDNLINKVQNL